MVDSVHVYVMWMPPINDTEGTRFHSNQKDAFMPAKAMTSQFQVEMNHRWFNRTLMRSELRAKIFGLKALNVGHPDATKVHTQEPEYYRAASIFTCDSILAVVSVFSCSRSRVIWAVNCCFSSSHALRPSSVGRKGLLSFRPDVPSGIVLRGSPIDTGDSLPGIASVKGFSWMTVCKCIVHAFSCYTSLSGLSQITCNGPDAQVKSMYTGDITA